MHIAELAKWLELAIFAIVFFLLGSVFEYFRVRKEKKDYKEAYKQMIENFLSLNVTHLHDSANLFNLIKNNSEERNIINFATGSAYHFRSLFNSLKKSITQIRDYDADELDNSTLFKLIEKEEVNLKDLINIELFQLGNFSQIETQDNTQGEYAFTYGNFELLSKVFLNLVENALKYSKDQIKISLNDEDENYTIRIMSFGTSISEEISIKINNKIYNDIEGHGLSSLVDIMNYHDANIHITSLPGEGSSVSLEFKKEKGFVKQEHSKEEEFLVQKTFSKKPKTTIGLCALLLVLALSYGFIQAQVMPVTEIESKNSRAELDEASIRLESTNIEDEDLLNNLIDNETMKLGLDMEL